MGTVCDQHSGCIARLEALEKHNDIQDTKLDDVQKAQNKILGAIYVVPALLTLLQICFIVWKFSSN